MKKLLCMLLTTAVIVCAFTVPVAAAGTKKFADIPAGIWYEDAVYTLVDRGIINGVTDNTFNPDGTLTVEQLIKMAVLTLGTDIEQGTGKEWAQPYIDYALANDILQKGEFTDYRRPITRGEIAKILVRCVPDEVYPENYVMYQSMIKDYSSVADADKDYVLRAYVSGMMEGYPDKTFKAAANLTRAEAATVVLRLTEKAKREPVTLPAQTGNESFIEPDLRVTYYYEVGYPYYFTVNLFNCNEYKGKGYKIKTECTNYSELNSRVQIWGKKSFVSTENSFYNVDNIIKNDGEIYTFYNNWYLDTERTKFDCKFGMNICFKVTLKDENGNTEVKYMDSIIQDRDF